jgi:PKD repeat protein
MRTSTGGSIGVSRTTIMYSHRASTFALVLSVLLCLAGASAWALTNSLPPGGNFNLNNWYLQLPTENGSLNCTAGSVDSASTTQLIDGYTNAPYFYTGSDGSMVFWAPINGAKTGNTDFPRSELRELIATNSTGVNWIPYGTHILNAQCKVLQVPPSTEEVIIGQIHAESGDALPTVKVIYDNGKVHATVKTNSTDDGSDFDLPTVTVGLSNSITYEIELVNGLVTVVINSKTNSYNIFQSDPNYTNSTQYFKAGDYCQADSCTNPGNSQGAMVAFYVLTRYDAPSITNQPASQTVSVGSNVTFTVGALGSPPLGYAWLLNNTPINKATNATLTIPNVQLTNAGNYSVAVTDLTGGIVTSSPPATLTVLSAAPEANFTASPTNGVTPLGVTFTDTSSGSPTSWSWTFGDTGTSTSQNPNHTYTTPGTYAVTLIASNTEGSSTNTQANLITALTPPPVASFTASPTNGAAPLSVSFTDQSTGSITGWAWAFGDGNTSSNQNSSDIYVNPGVYTVQEIVSGLGGSGTDTVVNLINVYAPFAWWQLQYFDSTNNSANTAPGGDYTGTGMSNTNKFLAGFNPTNAAAYLHIISVSTMNGTNIDVVYLGANGDSTWSPGIASRTNVLDYAPGDAGGNYTNGGWQDTGQTNILSGGTGTGIVTNMVDAGGATNTPSRYYRVRVLVP